MYFESFWGIKVFLFFRYNHFLISLWNVSERIMINNTSNQFSNQIIHTSIFRWVFHCEQNDYTFYVFLLISFNKRYVDDVISAMKHIKVSNIDLSSFWCIMFRITSPIIWDILQNRCGRKVVCYFCINKLYSKCQKAKLYIYIINRSEKKTKSILIILLNTHYHLSYVLLYISSYNRYVKHPV